MKRAIAFAVTLMFVAGCSGAGSNPGGLLPGTSAYNAARGGVTSDHRRRGRVKVRVTMRIPKRHRREHAALHPATISPLTQSVSIAVNGGTPTIFNTTTSSSNCSSGSSGLTCNFVVIAPPGNDTFSVVTYSAVSGGGNPLNSGTAVVAITPGTANSAHVTLGPVVSITADTGVGSLRYAIGTASPGDTIMFMLPSGSTLTVGSPLTLNTSVSIAGPGVTTSIRMHHHRRHTGLHGNVSFDGVTIDGGGAQQIFVVKSGVTATISGLILSDGLATTTNQPGGAIYNEGNLTLANDALQDNDSQVNSPYVRVHHHAQRARHKHYRQPRVSMHGLRPHCATGNYYGGAVYNHGILAVSGSTFDSNVLTNTFGCGYTYGGAIYNDQYGTLTSTGNTYSSNSAYYGGAVYNNSSYGQASFANDTFTANVGCQTTTGCALTGCGTPTTTCSTYPYGEGGAIDDAAGPGVTIANSTFSNNGVGGVAASSAGYGGALYLGTGSPSVTGSTFSGNLAGGGTANCSYGYGGAIYEDASNTLELDNDTFTNNVASGDDYGYGGAVYNDNDADNGSGNTFTGNQAIGTGSTCHTDGTAEGGAIFADYGITMSASTFTNNSVAASYSTVGGAIYMDDPSNLSSDTFTGNSATTSGANGASGSYAEAGAIDNDSSLRLTNSTLTGNTVSGTGNGSQTTYVYAAASSNDGSLVSSGNTISSNTASQSGTATTGGIDGGAVYTDGWSSNHDTISSNTATAVLAVYGGAIYNDSTVGISNATITNNSAASSATTGSYYGVYGGGMYLYSTGSSSLSNSTISGNTAGSTGQFGFGGGIYDDAQTSMGGLVVTNNTATTAGGGVYTDTSDAFANSTVSGNTVTAAATTYGGGGMYSDGPTIITNSTFSSNSVVAAAIRAGGGGVFNDYQTTMSGSTISGNSVTGNGAGSGGGGIFNYDNGTFTNDTITGNTSALDGGGYESYDAGSSYNPLFVNVTFYKNTATGAGGNIRNPHTMEMGNTIVAGGTAAGAANDIDNTGGTLTSDDYNLIQTFPITGNALGGSTSNNKTAVDPALLPLSNNGGPTFTVADQATSPGAAYIPWTSVSGGKCGTETGVAVDQRGFTRGTGGKCDIGAFEANGVASAIKVHPKRVRGDSRHKHAHHHRRPVKPVR